MLAQPSRGRAWRSCPKPRRRSWLRKQSAQALQTAINPRVVSTGRRGGPSGTTSASGGTPERRLWAIQREDRRLAGAPTGFCISVSDGFPQRRAGAIKETLHPAALASRIVILADGFARDWFRLGHAHVALCDVEIPALIASFQLCVQP